MILEEKILDFLDTVMYPAKVPEKWKDKIKKLVAQERAEEKQKLLIKIVKTDYGLTPHDVCCVFCLDKGILMGLQQAQELLGSKSERKRTRALGLMNF